MPAGSPHRATASRYACLLFAVASLPGLAWTQQNTFRSEPGETLPDFALDSERRIDPEADQWRSEVLHDAAKPIIKHFLEDLVAGRDFDVSHLTSDFVCNVLRPDLQSSYDDGVIVVRRARGIPPDALPLDRLAGLAREFRAAAPAEASIGGFLMKLVSVELEAANRFRMRVYLHAHAESGGRVLQWNLELGTRWQIGASDEDLKLAGVRLLKYEEVAGPAKLLPDHSLPVFGGTPGYREQVLFGTENWTNRVDRMMGKSFNGAQGIAVGDVDGDGHDDVYLCQQAGLPNRLWLWRPGGTPLECSATVGLDVLDKTRSALIADFDGDGFADLALSIGPDVALCWNDGKGKFEPMRVVGPVGAEIYSLAAADTDRDGDLDLYACRYVADGLMNAVPIPYHDANNGAENVFWRNEGGRRLSVATQEVGLDMNNKRFSLAATFEDVDDDGDQDLYVANDFGRNNLYLNDKGKFKDVAAERGCEDLASGMGASFGDVDQDGDADLYVTNMFSSAGRRIASQQDRFMDGEDPALHQAFLRYARGNSLLLNDGRGKFTDVTDKAGVAVGLWGWGSLFFEFNNDGRADIYAPNGFITSAQTVDL